MTIYTIYFSNNEKTVNSVRVAENDLTTTCDNIILQGFTILNVLKNF